MTEPSLPVLVDIEPPTESGGAVVASSGITWCVLAWGISGGQPPSVTIVVEDALRSVVNSEPTAPSDFLARMEAGLSDQSLVCAAAAAIDAKQVRVASVGDVRVHLFHAGQPTRTSREHTLGTERSDITDHVAGTSFEWLTRITTRALGGPHNEPWLDTWPLSSGSDSVLVLCTPRLHEFRDVAAYAADACSFEMGNPGRVRVQIPWV